MESGLSAIYLQGVVKYSLGWTVTNLPAKSTAVGIGLHSGLIDGNRVSASEWTSAGAANTNYTVRKNLNIDTGHWTVNAFDPAVGVIAINKDAIVFFSPSGLTGSGSQYLFSIGLYDTVAIGSGNLIYFADQSTSISNVNVIGNTVTFNAGDIQHGCF